MKFLVLLFGLLVFLGVILRIVAIWWAIKMLFGAASPSQSDMNTFIIIGLSALLVNAGVSFNSESK